MFSTLGLSAVCDLGHSCPAIDCVDLFSLEVLAAEGELEAVPHTIELAFPNQTGTAGPALGK